MRKIEGVERVEVVENVLYGGTEALALSAGLSKVQIRSNQLINYQTNKLPNWRRQRY